MNTNTNTNTNIVNATVSAIVTPAMLGVEARVNLKRSAEKVLVWNVNHAIDLKDSKALRTAIVEWFYTTGHKLPATVARFEQFEQDVIAGTQNLVGATVKGTRDARWQGKSNGSVKAVLWTLARELEGVQTIERVSKTGCEPIVKNMEKKPAKEKKQTRAELEAKIRELTAMLEAKAV